MKRLPPGRPEAKQRTLQYLDQSPVQGEEQAEQSYLGMANWERREPSANGKHPRMPRRSADQVRVRLPASFPDRDDLQVRSALSLGFTLDA